MVKADGSKVEYDANSKGRLMMEVTLLIRTLWVDEVFSENDVLKCAYVAMMSEEEMDELSNKQKPASGIGAQ